MKTISVQVLLNGTAVIGQVISKMKCPVPVSKLAKEKRENKKKKETAVDCW